MADYANPTMDFDSFMIKSFRPDKENFSATNKVMRYHYTSANALMKILKHDETSACIRFTDIRYLNDKSEMFYFLKILFIFLQNNKGKFAFCEEVINELLCKQHSYQDYIDMEVSSIAMPSSLPVSFATTRSFVFCTCKDSDSLHMWNYYASNGNYQGYNIGINIYKFLKSFDIAKDQPLDPIFFKYGNVIYSQVSQEKEIEKLLSNLERSSKVSKNKDDYFVHAMYDLYQYIHSYGLFFKDKAFEDEEEYRIIIEISEHRLNNDRTCYTNKYNKQIKFDFFERKGIFVPCLFVPFEKESIEKITMAPIMEHSIGEKSLREFLDINGYGNINVAPSEIPIRF